MVLSVMGNPFRHQSDAIQIEKQVIERLFTEGREALPTEYTALLAGHGSRITTLYSAPPDDTDLHTFNWSGQALLDNLRKMKQDGVEWLGVVHTHPTAPPIPSSADKAGWHYPELSYWIASFMQNENALCCYKIVNNQFVPISFTIV
ncbi:Mov34/MPN/PAD-1 family protein [Brevibacillus sp. SYSU BS000544]|uniref:Mov34/MPN/PAD-1 family protein n=1 Tax=Brevibacillus sp. SYSU BS000544 TaxID=3416443 RepID=UPI003CE4F31D